MKLICILRDGQLYLRNLNLFFYDFRLLMRCRRNFFHLFIMEQTRFFWAFLFLFKNSLWYFACNARFRIVLWHLWIFHEFENKIQTKKKFLQVSRVYLQGEVVFLYCLNFYEFNLVFRNGCGSESTKWKCSNWVVLLKKFRESGNC